MKRSLILIAALVVAGGCSPKHWVHPCDIPRDSKDMWVCLGADYDKCRTGIPGETLTPPYEVLNASNFTDVGWASWRHEMGCPK